MSTLILRITAYFTIVTLLLIPLAVQANSSNDIGNHSNQTAIEYLYAQGVVSGYDDGTFKPDNTINRAELLKVLVGGKGIEVSLDQYSNCFPDVKEEWFAPFVCYAKEAGWVNGYDDGTFKPAQTVNKAEAIKMLVNSQGFDLVEDLAVAPYDDVSADVWFAPFIATAKKKGVLEVSDGVLNIGAEITRGVVSENLYRAMIVNTQDLNTFAEYNTTKQAVIGTDVNNEASTAALYKVVKVVDGDTIDVDDNGVIKRVRLLGIDTPETVHPNEPVGCYGPEASQKVSSDLLNNFVLLEKDILQDDIDKYGRLLRYVFLEDGTNYNEALIREGFATEYTYDGSYKYQSEFIEAESQSKLDQAGMWADGACEEQEAATDEGHSFYVSSQAKSKYYCDTDSAWENLSKKNLLKYDSEAELLKDFSNLTLNKPC